MVIFSSVPPQDPKVHGHLVYLCYFQVPAWPLDSRLLELKHSLSRHQNCLQLLAVGLPANIILGNMTMTMTKPISLSASLLMAAALTLSAAPAVAQYAGFKATISKQLAPDPGGNATIELSTLVPMPHQLMFHSLTTPTGVTFKGININSTCPEANGRTCRQNFTMAVDANSSGKCKLDGNYITNFEVTCLSGDSGCKPGQHQVGFSLTSENFCSETAVDIPAAKGWQKRWSEFNAKDISVGTDNTLWLLNNNNLSLIQRIDLKTSMLDRSMGTSAVRLDVGGVGNGEHWAVQADGKITRRTQGFNWETKPGLAMDIGVGANGTVWVIGKNAVPGGFGIYRWSGNDWTNVAGGAVRIDVDPQGNAWVVNSAGDVFQWSNGNWVFKPGVKAVDVGIGANNSVFVVGTDGKVYKAGPSGWVEHGSNGNGKFIAITVTAEGYPIALSDSHEAWIGER